MLGREIVGPPLPDVPFHSVPQLVAARAAVEPSRAAVRSRGPSGKWQDLSWSALDGRNDERDDASYADGRHVSSWRAPEALWPGRPRGVSS